MNRNRILAAALCLLLCLVYALSFTYVAQEIGHDCHDDHCTICAEIQAHMNVLKSFIFLLIVALFITQTAGRLSPFAEHSRRISPKTLVSLKVKFTN